jgi:hypothetical protein
MSRPRKVNAGPLGKTIIALDERLDALDTLLIETVQRERALREARGGLAAGELGERFPALANRDGAGMGQLNMTEGRQS